MTPLFSSALLRTQSDQRLVQLAREGHERAFEAIVDRYRKPLQRYCERALPRSRSEDVVQQVLMKAWVALQNRAQVRSLKPWLYRITRTTILEAADAPGYDYHELVRSLRPADGPDSELEQRAVIRNTLAGLAALPEAQREALLRTAFEGQSRAQIAEALGVSEGAVRQLLYRARASLRTIATAAVPLPLANWLAALGPSSAGSALESGAAGSAGVIGVAKASVLLATAGVMATGAGPVPDRHEPGERPTKARAVQARKAETDKNETKQAPIVKATSLHASPAEAGAERRPETQQDDQAESHNRDGGGNSERSRASGGEGDRQLSHGENNSGDSGQAQEGPSSSSGDQEKPADSGSGDHGD